MKFIVKISNISLCVLFLLVCTSCYGSENNDNNCLYPIDNNGTYGYMNKSGDIVIEQQFTHASRYYEELASVCINNKCGYIDKNGNIIIKPIFDKAYNFSEGLAAVVVNNKVGYINKKGEYIIKPQYFADGISNFHDGLASVQIIEAPTLDNFKAHSFINKEGVVVTDKYSHVSNFSEGIAVVDIQDNIFSKSRKGYIDISGKFVIPPKYESCGDFHEGKAYAKKNDKYGYIDKTGNFIIDPQYDRADDFSEGLACVKENHLWFYIDESGTTTITLESHVEYAHGFSEGLALVKRGKKYGFIDKKGKYIIEPIYDVAYEDFNCGLTMVGKEDGTWYYIDNTGKQIKSFKHLDPIPKAVDAAVELLKTYEELMDLMSK